jgi:SPP1 gp7 family putative phage head morphogenesis protein
MAARKRKSRKSVTFSPILTTKAQTDDLAAIYLRMLEPWNHAAEVLGEQYGRELERILQHDSPSDLGAITDAIAAAINRLVLELTPSLRRWALRTEEWHRSKWVRAVLSGVGIDLETLLGPEDEIETIDAFLARNTSLIRDINEQARGKVADAVLRGFQQRSPISDVTKEIREATGFARKRARRVAADQTVKLASALDAERQRQAGLDVWAWRHGGKIHFRPEHKARDGNLYSENSEQQGTKPSGKLIREPPTESPGELPFCSCVRQAVLVFEGEIL